MINDMQLDLYKVHGKLQGKVYGKVHGKVHGKVVHGSMVCGVAKRFPHGTSLLGRRPADQPAVGRKSPRRIPRTGVSRRKWPLAARQA